jgi:hypothetical protein
MHQPSCDGAVGTTGGASVLGGMVALTGRFSFSVGPEFSKLTAGATLTFAVSFGSSSVADVGVVIVVSYVGVTLFAVS